MGAEERRNHNQSRYVGWLRPGRVGSRTRATPAPFLRGPGCLPALFDCSEIHIVKVPIWSLADCLATSALLYGYAEIFYHLLHHYVMPASGYPAASGDPTGPRLFAV